MTINELRIGNYIEWVGVKSDSRILNLKDFNIVYESLNNNESYFKPILLTEEWLLKLGYIKKTPFFENNSIIEFYETYDKILRCELYGMTVDNIKYVHQLQNLYFALTGEELEYNK
jgi:hypothetical protein